MKKLLLLLSVLLFCAGIPVFGAVKVNKQGFDPETNTTHEVGGIVYHIPSYFSDFKDNVASADSAGKSEAVIKYETVTDEISDEKGNNGLTAVKKNVKDLGISNSIFVTDTLVAGEPAVICYGTNTEKNISVCVSAVYNTKSSSFTMIQMLESNAAKYSYLSDFFMILHTAEQAGTGSTEESAESSSDDTAAESSSDSGSSEGVTPEFKEKMDSIKDFFDEYCEFLEKYTNASSDEMLNMATDYFTFLTKYSECQAALDEIDEDKLSDADRKYYLDVMVEIDKRLLDVANYLAK